MNILSVENVSIIYGDKTLFKDISIHLNKGEKVALIAKNGTGKSSLLRTIVGLQPSDSASKIYIHKDITVGYLEQEPEMTGNATVMEEIFRSNTPILNAVRHYENCLLTNVDANTLQKAMEQMDILQAWDVESRLKTILNKLKITDLQQRVQTLSGGQRKRLALSRLLLEEPGLMLLDEPTNHLDPDMIDWLADYLKSDRFTILFITHDRYFLDKISTEIVELENGETQVYRGNYNYFVEKKAERREAENANILRAKNVYRKELEWMRMTPQARTTKAKARIDRFEDVEKNAHRKLETDAVEIEIMPQRLGAKIIELHHVSKGYGKGDLIHKFSYKFKRFEKLGIVGKNGVGKSTFLNLITQREKPDSGEVIIGDTVKIAFYTQDGLKLKADKRVIEAVRDVAEYIPLTRGQKLTAAQLCERFLFDNNAQYTYVSKLSGGEKRRLFLLTLLMQNPNFLILDEPTNDLDILTMNVLEEFLEYFPGCVVTVSHDRHFLDKIADHIFVFEGNGVIRDFNGTYSDYLEQEKQKPKEKILQNTKEKKEIKQDIDNSQSKRKLTFNEQRELEKIDKELPILETKKQELEKYISENGNEKYEVLQGKINELTAVCQTIETYTNRWFELSE